MKRFALILMTLALATAPAQAGGGFLKSVEEAKKEAKKNNQLIFVDFFAAWCGWCHKFDREVVPAEKFQNAVKDKVLLRVDTEDGKEGTELARRFGVTNLPTFMLLTPDLEIAAILRGYAPATEFAQELVRLEKEYKEFQKKVAGEKSITDPQQRLDLAREFHNRRAYTEAEKRLKALVSASGVKPEVSGPAYIALAMTVAAQGRIDDAAEALKKLIATHKKGESVEQAHFVLGQIYLSKGNHSAALAELKQLKSSFPKSEYVPATDRLIDHIEKTTPRGN